MRGRVSDQLRTPSFAVNSPTIASNIRRYRLLTIGTEKVADCPLPPFLDAYLPLLLVSDQQYQRYKEGCIRELGWAPHPPCSAASSAGWPLSLVLCLWWGFWRFIQERNIFTKSELRQTCWWWAKNDDTGSTIYPSPLTKENKTIRHNKKN